MRGSRKMAISIKLLSDDLGYEEARDLCREWLKWHWENYPSDWPVEGNPMEPERFKKVLEDMPNLHARPRGGIFVASIADQPVGCVMYSEQSDLVAEFNRMFVSEAGRGHGVGRRLLDAMFNQMIEDGYQMVMFTSAKFLTHAKAMYENVGFTNRPHPEGFPDEWIPYTYCMERSLRD